MKENKNTLALPQGITQDMVDKAKAKHGDVNIRFAELPVDEDGGEYLTVLVCRPTKQVKGEAEKHEDSNPLKAKEIMINGTLLSHKTQVLANDYLFLAAYNAAEELLPIRSAVIMNVPEGDLPDGITRDMVKEAIKDNGEGNVKLAKLAAGESERETRTVLVRRPSRKAMSDYEKWASMLPNKAKKSIIDATLLSHEDEVKENAWMWYSAFSAGVQLVPQAKAVIKNF